MPWNDQGLHSMHGVLSIDVKKNKNNFYLTSMILSYKGGCHDSMRIDGGLNWGGYKYL